MKRKFKHLILMTAMLVVSNLLNAQTSDAKKYVGFWTTDASNTRLVFFIDKNDKLQLVEWSSYGGEEMDIMGLEVFANKIKTTERFNSTNHVTFNEYILTDIDTLKNIINGDANTTIYFKRLK